MQAYKLIMNTSFAQLKQHQDLKHQHFEYNKSCKKKHYIDGHFAFPKNGLPRISRQLWSFPQFFHEKTSEKVCRNHYK